MQIDPDPDPTCHSDVDPDPYPAYHFYANPDPDPTFQFDPDPQFSVLFRISTDLKSLLYNAVFSPLSTMDVLICNCTRYK